MGLEIHFGDCDFNVIEVEEALKTKKQALSTQVAEQLKHLIGDLKYLEEMKRLEGVKEGEKMARIPLYFLF